MFLARHSGNRTGKCIKTQGEIATNFRISRETVNRYISVLASENLIAIEDNGANQKTYFILEVPKSQGACDPKSQGACDPKSQGACDPKSQGACDLKSHPCDLKSQPLSDRITPLLNKVTSNKEARLSSKLSTKLTSKQGEQTENAPLFKNRFVEVEDLPATQLAQKVISELCLGEVGLPQVIGAKIDQLVKFKHLTKSAAVELLVTKGREAINAGESVNRFWFTDLGENKNGNRKATAAEQRVARIIQNARDISTH